MEPDLTIKLTRQTYGLEVSTMKFPNMEFHGQPEVARVVQKLFWSCRPSSSRFGLKRGRMEAVFPRLCQFYDEYFYNNQQITQLFTAGSPQPSYSPNF